MFDSIISVLTILSRGFSIFPEFYDDARVKSLKPRCACTGVVLWLNDPPRYEHKSGAQASRYANIGSRYCGSTKYGTIRKASFDLNIF